MDASAQSLLERLERREARLLCWGVTDVEHTRAEIEDLGAGLGLGAADCDDAVACLEKACVLFGFQLRGSTIYRSRMAETVRLMERLRQVFRDGQWDGAPRLVSGFRFHLHERKSPRRDLEGDDTLKQLADLCPPESPAGLVARALISDWRLSAFQLRAMRAVLRAAEAGTDAGVMVTAGTGTGKTLAFYLPGLALLGARLAAASGGAARILAIYPRQELLKDQMSTAVKQIRRLDDVWAQLGRRPRIAALYSDAPLQLSHVRNKWDRRGRYFVCPYVRSPDGNPMGILEGDVDSRTERLRELLDDGSVGIELGPDSIVISRQRMLREPPDLLLCTTEMINRGLSDIQMRRLLTGDGSHGPRLILLDEVHLYEGISGAQTALTLRRWRHAVGRRVPICFVGLSATLLDAERFFADVTGVPERSVELVKPLEEESEVVGSKYSLVLRGDPYSRAQLLSTSLQACMLMSRMLDGVENVSEGVYPRKTFVFTDDLDVTQRLLSDLRDAERGGPCRIGMPLAGLRSGQRFGAERGRMFLEGQHWAAAEKIGHDLQCRKEVTEVSSRSRGLDPEADIVVATASLEVGFDDDLVGAVIQHKAPRSSASFIQRIGRAGRQIEARPWSVVVLSDYGRDRLAYQAYEELFDPVLAPPRVPLRNRYLLGMQAAYATLDWLCVRMRDAEFPWGSAWKLLAGPADLKPGHEPKAKRQVQEMRRGQEFVVSLLEDVVAGRAGVREDLSSYLAKALVVEPDVVQQLCWEQPRPIIAELIPTARRRLVAQWRTHLTESGEPGLEDFDWDPLPEFVPGTLFSNLNLPEVVFRFPMERKAESMPIEQALRAFAPGRVNKRFTRGNGPSFWCLPDDHDLLQALLGGAAQLDLSLILGRHEPLGAYVWDEDGVSKQSRVFRPRILDLHVPPGGRGGRISPITVGDTMNARLLWHTQIDAVEASRPLAIPALRSGWRPLMHVQFQTHGEHRPADVRRFATGSRVSIRVTQGRDRISREGELQFIWGERRDPAALGYTMQADAARFEFAYPPDLIERCLIPEVLPSLRLAWLRHRWMQDPDLPAELEHFAREHLLTVALVGLSAWSAIEGIPLAEAARSMLGTQDTWERAAKRALSVILGSTGGREAVEEDLRASLSFPAVRERLDAMVCVLWEDLRLEGGAEFESWLRERYRSTLGHAVLAAARTLCREFDERDLVLDLDAGYPIFDSGVSSSSGEAFWLVETTPGGAGAVEALADAFAAEPARFARLVDSAFRPGDWEVVDAEMSRALELLAEGSDLAECVVAYREAESYGEKVEATERLKCALADAGVRLTDAVSSTVFSRWLRAGSSESTDALLRELLRYAKAWEECHGVELDARTLAFHAGTLNEFRDLMRDLGGPDDPEWRSGQAYSLLWPRGMRVRSEAMKSYSPFADHPDPDRLLVSVCAPHIDPVCLDHADWEETVADRLISQGRAALAEGTAGRDSLAIHSTRLLCTPVFLGALRVYPRLAGIESRGDQVIAQFELAEVVS